MRALSVFLIAFFASFSPGHIAPVTGNELLEACTGEDVTQAAFCAVYIDGVRDGLVGGSINSMQSVGAKFDDIADFNYAVNLMLGFCISEQSAAEQQKDAVVDHLQRNPGSLYVNAHRLVLRAFREAFPCTEDLVTQPPE